MRILHVISTFDHHGAARQLELLARELPRPDFDVRVCVLGGETENVRRLRACNGMVEVLGWTRPVALGAWWGLRRVVKSCRPDVIQTWDAVALRAVALAKRGRRVIAALPARDVGWFERWLLRGATRVVVRGDAERSRGLGFKIGADRIVTVRPAPTALGAPSRESVLPAGRWIVCAGRLDAAKGFYDAVWAFDYLRYLYDDVHLLLVGEGPERARLHRLIRGFGSEGHVHLLGERGDADALIARADVVWIPERGDGGVHVALEAMAAGRAVVATRTPMLSELIRDGETGRLVEVGDKVRCARRTRELLDSPQVAAHLGEAARQYVMEHFSARDVVGQYARLYAEVAA